MIEIRNLLFQPMTFQLAGEERGLHLGSRQRKLVDDAQVSEEIRIAAKRGFVALTMSERHDQLEAQPMAAETTEDSSDTAVQSDKEPAAEECHSNAEPEPAEQPEETADETRSRRRR